MKKLLVAMLAGLFAGFAYAGDTYTQLDANQDGMISQEEAQALPPLAEQWTEVDVNADGTVDAAEFAKFEAGSAIPEGAAPVESVAPFQEQR